ncbi:MAG: prepilin peptidase [Clostridiales bacterium]|nr:prepilin peptidase [Clostridiales bacterium]
MPLFEVTFIAVYTLVLAFIFGAVLASFITCTAGRILAHEDWTRGFSHCDTCGHKLGILDLFPIFSYLILGGKCRYCGAKVPIRCLISEVLLAVAFTLIVLAHGVIDVVMVRNLLLAMLMMGISFCEIDGHIIHEGFITAMLVVWIGALPFVPELQLYIADKVIACALVCGILMLVSYMRSSRGSAPIKPELIKLIAVFLLYTGLIYGLSTVAIAFLLHSFVKPFKKTIVPALSVCTIVFLCNMDVVKIVPYGYVTTLIDYIKVF